MRIFRLIKMALLAIIISVNLTACSDDDKDVNSNSLEGTWGLTEATFLERGSGAEQSESWTEIYNPFNPTQDCTKIVIQKSTDNSYFIQPFYYYNSQWNNIDKFLCTWDGNVLIGGEKIFFNDLEDLENIEGTAIIQNLTSEQLVLLIRYTNQEEDIQGEMTATYKRM